MAGQYVAMPERAVFVRLKGGLGNQLFQFATVYALACRNEGLLNLEIEYYFRDTIREYELDALGIDAAVATASEVEHFAVDHKWRRVLGKTFGSQQTFLRKGLYIEPHFHFSPDILQLQPPVLIDGYWQSDCYSADFADELRAMVARPE